MTEGAHLRVGEPGEEGDDAVHHVLVVDDAVLALAHQHHDEVAEVDAELLPLRPGHDQWVVATLLKRKNTDGHPNIVIR